jgi:hypothetical protein
MGVHKGTDNFAESRSARIAANLRLIEHVLEKQRKRRIPYPDLSALAADVAERTGLHRTTLTRKGSKYLKSLLTYLAEQPGASTTVRDEDATPELLRAKLYDARLEIRILKNRLALADSTRQAGPASLSGEPSDTAKAAPSQDWYLAFADTAMALKLLVDRLNQVDETVRIDTAEKQILDLSAPPRDQVVVASSRARWFIDFYKKLSEQERGTGGAR